MFRKVVYPIVVVVAVFSRSGISKEIDVVADASAFDVERKWAIGLTTGKFTSRHYLIEAQYSYPGVSLEYLYFINSKFQLGILSTFKTYQQNLQQLTYGLSFNHYVIKNRLKISYGLLQQMINVQEFSEAVVAHNTMFGLTYEFKALEKDLFFKGSFHYSRLRYFKQKSISLNNLSITFGAFI